MITPFRASIIISDQDGIFKQHLLNIESEHENQVKSVLFIDNQPQDVVVLSAFDSELSETLIQTNSTGQIDLSFIPTIQESAGSVDSGKIPALNAQGVLDSSFIKTLPEPVGIPSTNESTGIPGQIAINGDYLYICIAPNTWRRIFLNNW